MAEISFLIRARDMASQVIDRVRNSVTGLSRGLKMPALGNLVGQAGGVYAIAAAFRKVATAAREAVASGDFSSISEPNARAINAMIGGFRSIGEAAVSGLAAAWGSAVRLIDKVYEAMGGKAFYKHLARVDEQNAKNEAAEKRLQNALELQRLEIDRERIIASTTRATDDDIAAQERLVALMEKRVVVANDALEKARAMNELESERARLIQMQEAAQKEAAAERQRAAREYAEEQEAIRESERRADESDYERGIRARELALDSRKRTDARRQMRAKEREDRRFQRLLDSARNKVAANARAAKLLGVDEEQYAQTMNARRLSKSEALALEADRLMNPHRNDEGGGGSAEYQKHTAENTAKMVELLMDAVTLK